MHADNNFAIYWEPSGYSSPASYKDTIDGYFKSVAADSGLATNVYSVDTQYSDGAGKIAYSASFGGRIVDTNAYPPSGCPQQAGNPCLTDAQLIQEVDRVVSANGLSRGLGTIYYVFTPQNVGAASTRRVRSAPTNFFCAYHSSLRLGRPRPPCTPFSPMPRSPAAILVSGPNASPADATINVVSHENNESITDPLGTAWFDCGGNENGDKCNFNFGSPLGGSTGALFNEQFSSGHYWLQQEWSNLIGGCAQRQSTTDDFFISASPTSLSVTGAGQASTTISTTLSAGTAQAVTLSAAGLPAGATGKFSVSPVTVGGSSSFIVTTTASTPPGTYPITVTGTGPSATHTATVTLTVAAVKALFTYPTAGQQNVDTSKAFTWSTVPAAQAYYLYVGTTFGGYDLVNSGVLPASQSSFVVPALPTGQTLYARIWTEQNGVWGNAQDITFTAAQGKALFTYPTAGQQNVDTSKAFTWSTVPAAQAYYLMVGTSAGGYDLVNSGVLPVSQSSYVVPALPTGQTLYARIFTEINGSWGSWQDITFTAAQGKALFTYPTAGQQNVDTSKAFTWSTVPSAQAYYLMVGTSGVVMTW